MVDRSTDRNCFSSARSTTWEAIIVHVDQVLHNGSICHCERGHPESKDDSVDGRKGNAHLSEKRVHPAIENWNKDDDGNLT